MLAERRTVDERIGVELADGYCGSAVHALGLVGMTEKAADAVFRFRQGLDSKEHGNALNAILVISRALDAKWNWRYKNHEQLAANVLEFWTVPNCLACFGRKREVIPDTPMLGEICPSCGGSGQRPYPWARSTREGRYHTETLWAVQEAERRIRMKMVSRLAREIRDSGVLENNP